MTSEGATDGKSEQERRVMLYSDGACRGNPGIGACAAILCCDGREKEVAEVVEYTTNNRMELQAVIRGLECLAESRRVQVVTDSQYVFNGMTKWVSGWLKNDWRNARRKPVLNRDLWERLLALANVHDVKWQWIRGHAGHDYNERCDRLANRAIDEYKLRPPTRD